MWFMLWEWVYWLPLVGETAESILCTCYDGALREYVTVLVRKERDFGCLSRVY
jgi:hypothetical protein